MPRFNIPENWTPETAIAVIDFLLHVIGEIWDAHLDEIFDHMDRTHSQKCDPVGNPKPTASYKDIPF
jgi:hypothetical protein